MGSMEAVRILLVRSGSFFKSAVENLARGLYDVACFEADQAVQLMLKAHIVRLSGMIPRTHSIRRLLGELGRLTDRENDVKRFVKDNRGDVIMLEDAYLRSRYAAEGYERGDTETCLEVARRVMAFAEELIRA